MLIPFETIFKKYNLHIKGIVHIGAHECEEKSAYNNFGILDEKIIWIEAMNDKCLSMQKHHQNIKIINAVVSNLDDLKITFNISNNGQSSSILELDLHKQYHPSVHYVNSFEVLSKTITTIYKDNTLSNDFANFYNLDIQGAELLALKGISDDIFKNIDYIYTEVNTDSVYKDCAKFDELTEFLRTKGFKLVEIEMTPYKWGDAFYIRF
jgi:FkbM family methyltransferase